ncbi:unnamed protein product, partial [Ectocarpus sp. 12 AP-2014]
DAASRSFPNSSGRSATATPTPGPSQPHQGAHRVVHAPNNRQDSREAPAGLGGNASFIFCSHAAGTFATAAAYSTLVGQDVAQRGRHPRSFQVVTARSRLCPGRRRRRRRGAGSDASPGAQPLASATLARRRLCLLG